MRSAFDELSAAEILGSPEAAWTTLRGMWFEVHDEHDVIRVNAMFGRAELGRRATGHLAALALGDILLSNLGQRLTRSELLDQLAESDIQPLAAGSRATARDQVRAVTASWRDTIQRELLQPPIELDEAAEPPQNRGGMHYEE